MEIRSLYYDASMKSSLLGIPVKSFKISPTLKQARLYNET